MGLHANLGALQKLCPFRTPIHLNDCMLWLNCSHLAAQLIPDFSCSVALVMSYFKNKSRGDKVWGGEKILFFRVVSDPVVNGAVVEAVLSHVWVNIVAMDCLVTRTVLSLYFTLKDHTGTGYGYLDFRTSSNKVWCNDEIPSNTFDACLGSNVLSVTSGQCHVLCTRRVNWIRLFFLLFKLNLAPFFYSLCREYNWDKIISRLCVIVVCRLFDFWLAVM